MFWLKPWPFIHATMFGNVMTLLVFILNTTSSTFSDIVVVCLLLLLYGTWYTQ